MGFGWVVIIKCTYYNFTRLIPNAANLSINLVLFVRLWSFKHLYVFNNDVISSKFSYLFDFEDVSLSFLLCCGGTFFA